eukprot:TRINITY_DN3735_c0_g2_i1.p1 TRINITY_DN3735_c0_g2~~TRINITY_DN3735_c0_g2_i1.p1  ORF type:complete len:313 (-),score=70.35 TRINITY_DN3735_c0_g2_i1:263-1201(-)
MPPTQDPPPAPKPRKTLLKHLVAGGAAGLMESSVCHPLDTIKTRMQNRGAGGSTTGPITTAVQMVKKGGVTSLYKGLTAVQCGIVPKMAIRFSSFEQYKLLLADKDGKVSTMRTLTAGIMAGTTEALLVVTPAEVCKIRIQSQYHSMMDPMAMSSSDIKYRNAIQTAMLVVKEEGPGALWKGAGPTVLRQASNQGINFTTYQSMKRKWLEYSKQSELAPWQHLLMGGLSGGVGPLFNNPLDVVKTRMQRQQQVKGQDLKYPSIASALPTIVREEGVAALWKGIMPRLMRIMPGQAITFMTYERVSKMLFDGK